MKCKAVGANQRVHGKRPSPNIDRFIPPRAHRKWNTSCLFVAKEFGNAKGADILTQDVKEAVRERYRRVLRRAMDLPGPRARLLFAAHAAAAPADNAAGAPLWPVHGRRRPTVASPDCALDLPEFKALYYYNLLDWGATGYLAAALNWSVFLCHPTTSKTIHLTDIDNSQNRDESGEYGTALKWDIKGTRLAVGTSKSNIQVWNTVNKKLVGDTWCTCIFRNDCSITSLVWSVCDNFLVSGCSLGKLSFIISPSRRMGEFIVAHVGAVETLLSSPDGRFLVSAGNDNAVRLWTWPNLEPYFEILFDIPAKALAWHPWKPSLLAVGGGVKQGTISVYNVNNCRSIAKSTPRTKGTILSLAWSKLTGELVASYWMTDPPSSSREGHSEVLVLSSLDKVVDKFMIGFQTQVMYLLWSPDGRKIATASTDETLRIWSFIDGETDKNLEESQCKKNTVTQEMGKISTPLFTNYVIR